MRALHRLGLVDRPPPPVITPFELRSLLRALVLVSVMGPSALRKGTQHNRQTASRVTIADIARTAHVAKSSASYALNGRPGVADATRERVVAVAEAMGWRPNCAARALSAARANVVGLVLGQPNETLGFDTFH